MTNLRPILSVFIVAGLVFPMCVAADPPPDYYATVDDSNSSVLRISLHEVIDDHTRFPYTASSTDTWDVLELADQDTADPGSILDVYRNATYTKVGGGNAFYNREHTWPKTYGFPDDSYANYPYTDCHQLMLCDINYNSDRGSRLFATCDEFSNEDSTLDNHGIGGESGTYPGNSNWYTGSDGPTGSWETWNARRGDVARAQLYMDVRYEGGVHGVTGHAEPDLILTDNRLLIQSTSSSPAYMGLLSVLLQWHLEDPVDDTERQRNDVVGSYQGNRNPFVDHPEWVECVFLDTGCALLLRDGFESGDFGGWSAVVQ
ncbi:MAG: endonuclease [Thermoanaerobaculales bacterium]|nr:endonuclease [Thermoanaerobaculales bacterium]